MKEFTLELKSILSAAGSALVGCGDLSGIANSDFRYGISVALPVEAHIVKGIMDGPTDAYFKAYHELNQQLDEIVLRGEEFLLAHGYHAYAQTTQRVREDAQQRTELPHKTIAVCAGIGWIGKSCLLVTEKYGSAVRLSSILTDAPLICDSPLPASKCKGCKKCVEACPAQALSGISWAVGVDRDSILNTEACIDKQMELTKQSTGRETVFLCGKCFAVCPFTQRYIQSRKITPTGRFIL